MRALRGALIGYGLLALGLASLLYGPAASSRTEWDLVLWGIAVQLVLMAARAAGKRYEASHPQATARAVFLGELAADGVTVLLFALATLRTITQALDAL
jgi:hypothetical protein